MPDKGLELGHDKYIEQSVDKCKALEDIGFKNDSFRSSLFFLNSLNPSLKEQVKDCF
ncbi:MAG: hypothetical protein HRT47_11090 [Candidatus Caenarcaniphilales bacterium]|nr:hypothetical protein [Candidatus Caenarcaniphilales bacterium]